MSSTIIRQISKGRYSIKFILSICFVCLIIGCDKSSGAQGPKGDTGAQGPKGDTGPAGSSDQGISSGTRLQSIQDTWVASDGAKYSPPSYTFHDQTLGVDCIPLLASDGQMRCLPTQVWLQSGSHYEDSACTIPIGIYTTPCGLPPTYGIISTATCGGGFKVYQLGSGVATVYDNYYGTCQAQSQSPSTSYVHISSEVPPSTFVAFTKQQ